MIITCHTDALNIPYRIWNTYHNVGLARVVLQTDAPLHLPNTIRQAIQTHSDNFPSSTQDELFIEYSRILADVAYDYIFIFNANDNPSLYTKTGHKYSVWHII